MEAQQQQEVSARDMRRTMSMHRQVRGGGTVGSLASRSASFSAQGAAGESGPGKRHRGGSDASIDALGAHQELSVRDMRRTTSLHVQVGSNSPRTLASRSSSFSTQGTVEALVDETGQLPQRTRLRPLSAQGRARVASPAAAARELYEGYYAGAGTVRGAKSKRPQSAKLARTQSSASTLLQERRHRSHPQLSKPRSKARPASAKRAAECSDENLEVLREREMGWNTDFVRDHALDERATGSGLSAIRRRKAPTGGKATKKKSKACRRRRKRKSVSPFQSLCAQVEQLWGELRIPERDRAFFRDAYLTTATPELQAETAARVQEQRDLLLHHRESTLEVLRLIQTREQRLSALRRLSVHRVCADGGKSVGPGDRRAAPLQPVPGSQRELHDVAREAGESKLRHALLELRASTVAVVHSIREWRRLLWRPHPFMWQSVNYLVKMQTDARFYTKAIDRQCTDPVFFSDSPLLQRLEDPTASRSDADEGDAAGNPADQPFSSLRETVMDEGRVQCELLAEHQRLVAAGYYIPMLRWSPEGSIDTESVLQARADSANVGSSDEYGEEEYEEEYAAEAESAADSGNSGAPNAAGPGNERPPSGPMEASRNHLDLLERLRVQIQATL